MRTADGQWTERRSEEGIDRERLRNRAAQRARQRLLQAHRSEYERYLVEERRKLGIEWSGA